MNYLVSLLLYHIGDWISRTTMFWGKGYGYGIYRQVMLWSVELDQEGRIWKYVERQNKKGLYTKKNSRNRRNSVEK